jgi:glyoxylase-like metal-dependent hydrolase (beta-lactamase superfamily II)
MGVFSHPMRGIDLRHLGTERVICAWEHDGVLVDPGPESCLDVLLDALGDLVPRAVLLTHIHFDHAGASGTLARRFGIPVYVHERGARHLVDPERLVASATRLYGEEGMRRLWGEVVPVPEEHLHVLHGGETVLGHRVEYAPGHASHHVAYLHEETGYALVGDVAGARIAPSDLVLAPTPPPDIDVAAWDASLDMLAAWKPTALCLTHFGLVEDPPEHIEAMREALHREAALVADHDLDEFVALLRREVEERTDPVTAASYMQAVPPDHVWQGLARWRQKQAQAATA